MKTVGTRALKNRLSEYLRLVQNGERVTVTNRGVAIARLTPAGSAGESAEEALLRLAREGEVRLGKPNRPELYPPPPGLLSDEEVAALVNEVRDDP